VFPTGGDHGVRSNDTGDLNDLNDAGHLGDLGDAGHLGDPDDAVGSG
jgi:hypothetical protein